MAESYTIIISIVAVCYMSFWCHILIESRCIKEYREHSNSASGPGYQCPSKCRCAYSSHFLGLSVDCSKLRLVGIPHTLPADAVELRLNENSITKLSSTDLDGCAHLQLLDLSQNNIRKLDRRTFTATINLKELYLNDNSIGSRSLSPGVFANLRKLRILYLHNNLYQYEKIYPDSALTDLVTLQQLSIDGISGKCFARGFASLKELLSLTVHGGIETITNDTFAVFANSSITVLQIQTETLYDVEPMSFAHFPVLRTLNLSHATGLGLLNASRSWYGLQYTNISKLVLTKLSADGEDAVSLNSAFFEHLNLTKIDTLLLDKNNIVDMQPRLSKTLTYLLYFDMSYNRISDAASLIIDLWRLHRLRYLDVSHQTRRYSEQRQKRSVGALPGHYDTIYISDNETSKNDFFDTCRTPPLKVCSTLRNHFSKYPLPDYGTWCLPLAPKLEVIKLSESLNVDLSDMPSIILFGSSNLRIVEYRLNGIHSMRGPIIITQPIRSGTLDVSDNKISCLSPDLFHYSKVLKNHFADLILNGNNLAAQMEADVSGITFRYLRNLISLHLASNGIKRLPAGVFQKLHCLQTLNLSQNSLRQVEFTFSHMKTLRILDVSGNLLTSLNPEVTHNISLLFETSNLTLNLLGNPLQCSCETLSFLQWINLKHDYLLYVDNYTCLYEGKPVRFSNLTVILESLDFQCSKQLAVIISASVLGLTMILVTIAVCCYRHRWELRYFCLKLVQRSQRYQLLVDRPTNFIYNAFVVYSAEDSDWVHSLVENLESVDAYGRRLQLCVHMRDFLPGVYILGNIWNEMERSYKVILVITKNFARSNFCDYELNLARMMSVEQARNLIIPIMLEEVALEDMSDSLRWIVRRMTYIEWPRWAPEREEFWQKLRDAVVDIE